MSSDKNDSGRLLAQPQQGKLIFFFSLFHDADRRATKRLLHRVQHDAVEWRKRTSTSVSFVVQLATCKGRRNEETGDRRPAEAQLTRPRRKMATRRNARAQRIHGVMKHPSIVPCMVKGASWEHGRGTPHSWTIIEHVVEQKTIWTWTWAHVAALTTGRILVHNLFRASTQVLHTVTYSRELNLKLGRVLTTSQEPQPGN